MGRRVKKASFNGIFNFTSSFIILVVSKMNFTLILLVSFNYSAETTSKNCHQLSGLFFICLILVGYLRENVVMRVEFLENKTCFL